MDQRTEALVDDVERVGAQREDAPVVYKTRDLWNYERNADDADVELWIGPYTDLKNVLVRVRAMDAWMVRYLDTAEPTDDHVPMALIYEPGSTGRLFH